MRAVFDTNIYISALVFPGGRAEKAVHAAADGWFDLLISKAIILEVLDVLTRKFGRDPEELSRVALFLADLASVVRPRKKLNVLRDDPDNRILECALAGHADMVVTGDHAMLTLQKIETVRILTLRDFLEIIDRSG
ncbi:MAG: putative toxin-antitoxin system toxin component, PIN family [Gammaproteobacteria bacterium]|nr:putative toxin-antitoxin system toxin component, PIN family [Gammaproteobacteria bacterium]